MASRTFSTPPRTIKIPHQHRLPPNRKTPSPLFSTIAPIPLPSSEAPIIPYPKSIRRESATCSTEHIALRIQFPNTSAGTPLPERLYRNAIDKAVDNDLERPFNAAENPAENTTRDAFPQVIGLPLLTHPPTSIRHGKIHVNHDISIMKTSPDERVRHVHTIHMM
ncbi:uncharacterized protein EAE97_004234 [Botrytis byssoidea]|uniref:Uncharacterized protein n=1 Tax=Botrytis byssoidea TaxID=139641 RepID=A0A9P5M6G0_9HELO|nr:uncharacterized protein EAE97_004234 [Botrytis byssoidea]KAF7946985.1 hypothetical protein EAE97_004234 [Botrytis byssoidea]